MVDHRLQKRSMRNLGFIVVVALGLTSCASTNPMRIALTELGTTSDSEYGAYGLRLTRSVNVTGLAAEEVVGMMTTDPDKWSFREQFARFFPTRTDLPDIMSPRLHSGQSQIVERTFCKDVVADDGTASPNCPTIEDLTAIKSRVQAYQAKVAVLIKQDLKEKILAAASRTIDQKPENKAELLKLLQSTYPDDAEIVAATTDTLSTVLAAKQADLKKQSLDTSKEIEALDTATSQHGIVITNWQRDTKLTAAVGAEGASANFDKSRKISGFLILGSPRVTTLLIGDDLVVRYNERNANNDSDKFFKLNRNYITFYQLRAKQVVFAESYYSALSAGLKLDIDRLVSKFKVVMGNNLNVDDLFKIGIKAEALYAAITAASESGVLDATKGEQKIHLFSVARVDHGKNVMEELGRSYDSVPIISVRYALDDFLDDYNGK